MRFIISLLLLTFFLNGKSQNETSNDLVGFIDFIGIEKSKALDGLVQSFDEFLILNYPKIKDENKRIKTFLEDFKFNEIWNFNDNKKLLALLETSGMRQETWLFGYENYVPKHFVEEDENTKSKLNEEIITAIEDDQIVPFTNRTTEEQAEIDKKLEAIMDSTYTENRNGLFLYGMDKYAPSDTLIQGFVEAMYISGGISPLLVANGILLSTNNYTEPFAKRLIAAEIYFLLISP